jgi:WhiB family redox-sensing transcriptional regulator
VNLTRDYRWRTIYNRGVGVPEWQDVALCRKYPSWVFFPDTAAGLIHAIEICSNCPVMTDCGTFAIRHRINHGVWGGMSERSRQRARRTKIVAWPAKQKCLTPWELPVERPVHW